jgi:hypothetical protein
VEQASEQDLTAKRVAENQATFRAANEDIEAAARTMAPDLPRIPFICECADTTCTRILRVRRDEYDAVRSDPTHFLVVPGHEVCNVDGVEVAHVLAREPGYSIMEKIGTAGEIARRLAETTDA